MKYPLFINPIGFGENKGFISSNEFEKLGELISYSSHGIKIETDEIVKPIYENIMKDITNYK